MKTKKTIALHAVIILLAACTKENSSIQHYCISDENSAVAGISTPKIASVTIGNQVWMKKDLTVSQYRNGDSIPEVKDAASWALLTTGAWCWYKNNRANGKLYNWYAVNDPRGLAPAGWHIPSDAEWTTLTTFLGGDAVAGGKMKETGTTYWLSPNAGATNSSGFTAFPGGSRLYNIGNGGTFSDIGRYGNWWTSSSADAYAAWGRILSCNDSNIGKFISDEHTGFSVRCIKD